MKPRLLNRICAHPDIIAWALGACALDGVLLGLLLSDVPLRIIVADWQAMLYLLAALIPATLLGSLLGAHVCGPLVLAVCTKINGAPLRYGDQVIVLSGPDSGTVAEVYEIYRGQGGWECARLDLGPERRERFRDGFDRYAVLKIKDSDKIEPVMDRVQRGVVVDEEGTPIVGAVVICHAGTGMVTRTGPGGEFTLEGMPYSKAKLYASFRAELFGHAEVSEDTPGVTITIGKRKAETRR